MADTLKPSLIPVRMDHTPSPDDPEDAPKFYQALGQLVVAWGRLEFHFLTCVLDILQTPNTRGPKLPQFSAEHVKLWKDAFRISLVLKPYENEAIDFADRMSAVSDDRNRIIHAHWEPFSRTEPLTAEMLNIKQRKGTDILEIKRSRTSTNRVLELVREASNLNIELLKFRPLLKAERGPPPPDVHIL
jgi:hypothetical protein